MIPFPTYLSFFPAFMTFDDPRSIFLDRSSAWNFFKNPYTLLGGHFSDPMIEKSELIFFSKRLVVFSFLLPHDPSVDTTVIQEHWQYYIVLPPIEQREYQQLFFYPPL